MDEIPHRHQHQHERCGYFAARALCHYAFPLCKMSPTRAVPTPRRLCRSDCEALETNVCRTLYDLASSHPAVSKYCSCISICWMWLGGVVVWYRTSDSKVAGLIPPGPLSSNNLSKLFTLMVLRPTQPSIPPG